MSSSPDGESSRPTTWRAWRATRYLDLPTVEPATNPAWHFFFVQLRLDRLRVDRGGVYQALRAEGIGVNVHYIPVHQHPFYRDRYPGTGVPGR